MENAIIALIAAGWIPTLILGVLDYRNKRVERKEAADAANDATWKTLWEKEREQSQKERERGDGFQERYYRLLAVSKPAIEELEAKAAEQR